MLLEHPGVRAWKHRIFNCQDFVKVPAVLKKIVIFGVLKTSGELG